MDIKEYFDVLADDDIRLKGTRIGIESILYEFIYREQTPETIVGLFPSLTLEQVYATILYYLQNKEIIEEYMCEWLEFGREMRKKQNKNPPPVVVKLRSLKEQYQKRV